MSNHSISSQDTWEIAYYYLHGYTAHNLIVIEKNGNLVCQVSIQGDSKLLSLQDQFFKSPKIPLNEFRNALHQVNSMLGGAKKKYKVQRKFEGGN